MLWIMLVILLLSSVLGYRIISSVPSLLHTPLMSGMNALSGITVLGALTIFASDHHLAEYFAAGALILAMINIAGGFWVTERMLKMFSKKEDRISGDDLPW